MSALFSEKKPSEKSASDIPPEFFAAVTVMGDEDAKGDTQASPSAAPAKATASPFGFSGSDRPSVPESSPAPANPFLGNDRPVMKDKASSGFSEIRFADSERTPNVPPVGQNGSKKVKILLIAGGVIVVSAIFGGAAYYYFLTKSSSEEVSSGLEPVPSSEQGEQLPGAGPAPLAAESAPFSPDKPNYLPLNSETAVAEEVRSVFSQTASSIMAADIYQPIEFLITDQNNNPIAFSRLAYMLNLELSEGLLNLIGESFSLYIYNDFGQPRLGLVLAFDDAALASQAIAREESGLPFALRTLLYDPSLAIPRESVFRSGAYGTETVRFTNMEGAENVSFDYVLRGKQWFIGSSKGTLRAVLDKNR